MSRGFIAAIIAVVITVVGYFGVWEWPAWPAFGVLYLMFGSGDPWLELSATQRTAVLVGLIAVNVLVWGVVAYALLSLRTLRRRVH